MSAPCPRTLIRVLVCAAAIMLSSQAVIAAEAPTPGSVQDTLPSAPPPKPQPAPPPIESAPRAGMPAAGGKAVPVKRFEISGNTVVSTVALQQLVQPYVGRELTLAKIYEVADALTEYYRAHGYGLADVTVPAQKVSDGVVKLQVIEGRIGKIEFQGNTRTRTSVLKNRTANIQPGDVYRTPQMERDMLLLNDLPGLNARAVVKPGTEFGTSDILIRTSEKAIDASVTGDNYGRDAIGRARISGDVSWNSPFGIGDRFNAGYLHSQEDLLNYYKLAYGLPAGPGRLRFSFNRASYNVGTAVFAKLDISGDNTNYRVDYTYPAVRSQNDNTYYGIAVTHGKSESVSTAAGYAAAHTNQNLLELSWLKSHVFQDNAYYTTSLVFSTNGQSNDGSDPGAQKARLQFDGSFMQPFARRWAFLGRISAEYSPDPLIDTQKFSLGGPSSVRGYLPSEVRGDRGAFLSAELRRYVNMGGLPVGFSLFGDTGKVWTLAALGAPSTSTSLSSAGVGLILWPGSTLSGSLQWAKPIGNYVSPNGDDGSRVWASFTLKY